MLFIDKSVSCAGLIGILCAACGAGESGLVLGKPLEGPLGGFGGVAAGSAGAGTGDPPTASAGSAGEAGNAAEDAPWLAERCRAAISFDNRDATARGQLFTDAVPSAPELIWEASQNACRRIYRDASEVPSVPRISLVVEDYDGVASTAGTQIRVSTRYLQSQADAGVDLAREIAGVLHFQTALIYQHPGSGQDSASPVWIVLGIADYVRLDSGYLERESLRPGSSYDSSSRTSALFLDYLLTRNHDAVYELNQRLAPSAPAWSDETFITLFGADLDALWSEFQSRF
jgi:hypothetical protein